MNITESKYKSMNIRESKCDCTTVIYIHENSQKVTEVVYKYIIGIFCCIFSYSKNRKFCLILENQKNENFSYKIIIAIILNLIELIF